jgi:hypothetical protein
MKKNKSISLTLLLSLFSLFAFSQRDKTMNGDPNLEIDSVFGNFMLVNSADSSKSFKLRDNSSYTLTYIEHPNDGVTREKIYFSNGNIRDLFDTKIDFDVINESIEQNFSDSSTINTTIDYSSFYYSTLEKPRSINIKDLQYLNYSSPLRSGIHNAGVGTMIVSAALVIALAPLLNIKFKGDMSINQTGYFNMAKVGLIGFAAGFPLSYFTRIKRYQITDNKIKNDKDFWYLSKETAY